MVIIGHRQAEIGKDIVSILNNLTYIIPGRADFINIIGNHRLLGDRR